LFVRQVLEFPTPENFPEAGSGKARGLVFHLHHADFNRTDGYETVLLESVERSAQQIERMGGPVPGTEPSAPQPRTQMVSNGWG